MQDLIPLQTAYAHQEMVGEDTDWRIYDARRKELGKLPANLTPKQAMSYIHFARPFEMAALNIGINFGKAQENKRLSIDLDLCKNKLKILEEQNKKLSTALEKAIIKQFNQED